MTADFSTDFNGTRRCAIIGAAKACFLQFGYDKTTLEDIARRAGIARPLIYRAFDSKLTILTAIYDDLFADRYPRALAILQEPGSSRDRLNGVYAILLLEPWAEMMGSPLAGQLIEACARLNPAQEAHHEARHLAITAGVLGDEALAKVFRMAVEGLQLDVPPLALLRERLEILIERFTD